MKEVLFYIMPSGKSPIAEFLNCLSLKEAQKVPKSEIALAKQRRDNYLLRKKHHE